MNTPVDMINNTKEELDKFHSLGWGKSSYTITKQQVKELLDGKLIAVFDGEYTYTIGLEQEDNK